MMGIRGLDHKKRLIVSLSLLLIVGFTTTTFVSFFVSRASLRTQISSSTLPITSDNVYSEIQRDLLSPILISNMMAHDTFLRDWIVEGEKDESEIADYLKEIMVENEVFTSFFVSEKTRLYYHPDGIQQTVKEDEERDVWYFRVREMKDDYEVNVDPDSVNDDAMTVFVNHRVLDSAGNYLGVTGVGLATDSIMGFVKKYRETYDRHIYFSDRKGNFIPGLEPPFEGVQSIHGMQGLSSMADAILSSEKNNLKFSRQGAVVHLMTRLIPELDWYLFVEQTEESAIAEIRNALVVNLLFCVLITTVAIVITVLTTNLYQKINREQQDQIAGKNQELVEKNAELEGALAQVKALGGLLPICASCKKIRDDKGYWSQIESYISEHSEAKFSHGLCPDCMKKLYPELRGD